LAIYVMSDDLALVPRGHPQLDAVHK
jgi:hypothetical protein